MLGQVALGGWAIPLAALGVSVVTFVFSARDMRRRGRFDYTDQLERRMKACEAARKEDRRRISELEGENLTLMRRVLNLERDQP